MAETESGVPPIGGPWQADIEANFEDPAVRATVDAFLRSKIQPRMTQLEQQIANTANARQLWEAFQQDPNAAYASITRELWGDELAEEAFRAMEAKQNAANQPPAAPPAAAPAEPAAPQQPVMDPRYEQMFEEWQRQQELAAYDAEIERITSDPANADIDANLIHTFVAAAEGDFDEAILRYREFATNFMLRYGMTPGEVAEQQAAAPAVLGQDAGGAGAAPPTQVEYRGQEGLHQAIDDAVAQMTRNRQAPPVT